ncbi:MAG: hypothetical protein EA361_16420 [Bacteroidetes bacterium]|nr:MAG: hypothetical protein EA361_16420 [Bacteroidota bacterium]
MYYVLVIVNLILFALTMVFFHRQFGNGRGQELFTPEEPEPVAMEATEINSLVGDEVEEEEGFSV